MFIDLTTVTPSPLTERGIKGVRLINNLPLDKGKGILTNVRVLREAAPLFKGAKPLYLTAGCLSVNIAWKMSKGLGQMERAILAELALANYADRVSSLAWRVAKRLGWGIWTLDGHLARLRRDRDDGKLTSEQYASIVNFVANDPRHRQHPEKLENKFSASFSRALKRLEQKRLIDRFQETTIERKGDRLFHVMYKVKGSPRHCRTVRVRLSGELENV